MTAERRAGQVMRSERQTAEMFVRYTDGTGKTMRAVEDTPENRRTLDRMAAHMLAKSYVSSIEVDIRTGRVAGYERSR